MEPRSWLDRHLPFRAERRVIRRWRRTRPFWSGVYLIAGGLEILAVPLSPLPVMVSLGIAGIASLAIGVILMVAGLFMWFAAQHRHFVGIVALVASIASFVVANLGGFLLGMLLGVLGSAMGFAWRPVRAVGATESVREKPRSRPSTPPAPVGSVTSITLLGGPGPGPGLVPDPAARSDEEPDEEPDRRADQGADRPAPAKARRRFNRRRAGGAASALAVALPLLIVASVLGPDGNRAQAAETASKPCTARDTAEACGGTRAAAAPAPTTTRIVVGATPPTITASFFAPIGFALAGVTTLETARGPLRVLVLTMRAAHLRDYRLATRDGAGPRMRIDTTRLDLDGNVRIYLTRLHGCIEGLICLDFAADGLPLPPIIPPFVFMTDVRAEQALVLTDKITTDLNLT
ncbi:DUF6114 domain-containing protein [Embleya sp. NPDC050154]|uniref:DUF6114 domain-containing protein n=1 Tax=Embleya sp. NPDC050154 TaxID=3363988 RepID=UPI00378E7479